MRIFFFTGALFGGSVGFLQQQTHMITNGTVSATRLWVQLNYLPQVHNELQVICNAVSHCCAYAACQSSAVSPAVEKQSYKSNEICVPHVSSHHVSLEEPSERLWITVEVKMQLSRKEREAAENISMKRGFMRTFQVLYLIQETT